MGVEIPYALVIWGCVSPQVNNIIHSGFILNLRNDQRICSEISKDLARDIVHAGFQWEKIVLSIKNGKILKILLQRNQVDLHPASTCRGTDVAFIYSHVEITW